MNIPALKFHLQVKRHGLLQWQRFGIYVFGLV
jgi:hypothetical protein